MLKDGDDLSWYARKAAGLLRPLETERGEGRTDGVAGSLEELQARGVKGSIALRTLYTRRLPPGCRGCLAGRGTNLFMTGLCTRDCFFCFNELPRKDETVIHGIRVREPEEACEIVSRYGLRSVGISGGEPLLVARRTLRFIRALRALSKTLRLDLYTNGDRLTEGLLSELKDAGLDALRFNLVANGLDCGPVKMALRWFEEVAVEIPAVPARLPELEGLVLELDRFGVPFLNIHELFVCRENAGRSAERGYRARAGEDPSPLLWEPSEGGDEAALRLLLFALKNARRLSAYYCSCRTQAWISRNGWRNRQRQAQGLGLSRMLQD